MKKYRLGKENGGKRMSETDLLKRITPNARVFGGKPIIRGHRLAGGRACSGDVGGG